MWVKKKPRFLSKKEGQFVHAQRRAAERHGIDLTRADYDSLIEQVQNQTAIFVRKQSLRVSVFTGTLQDQTVTFVYDKQRKTIVTFLPLEGE